MNPELLLTLTVFLLAGIPVLAMLSKGQRWPSVIFVFGGLAAAQFWHGPRASESAADHRPIRSRERGYVSSNSCRSCHPGEYHSWHNSFHRTMTQVASPRAVVGNFDNVSLSMPGYQLRLREEHDKYFVDFEEASTGKATTHEIVMTTGSHHMQFYWYGLGKEDRELGKLPFVYLFSEQRWVPAESTFLRPPSLPGSLQAGEWNQNCMNCHSTGPNPRLSLNRAGTAIEQTDSHVGEFGIACEACHGPGKAHIEKYANALTRYSSLLAERTDHDISHPDDIQSGVRSQICGQCHGITIPKDQASLRKVFQQGFDYRPGRDLMSEESDRILVQNDFQHPAIDESLQRDPSYLRSYFWADGMVRVTGREYNGLVRSPCFQHGDESKGVMQCMSCHVMHPSERDTDFRKWADDQLAANMRGDAACIQCHSEYEDQETMAAHTHHDFESAGSRCYNCHMPHTTYGLFKGIRSHTVSKPSVDESVFLSRPNACNLCHLDQSLAWTARHLDDWYGLNSPSLNGDQSTVAASILWATQGDAGTRVLTAWHMGWQPARQASGEDWIAPHLGMLMGDPYDAVRYVAYHALLNQDSFADYEFDYVSKADAAAAPTRVLEAWKASRNARSHDTAVPRLLLHESGDLDDRAMQRLLRGRDNRDVLLNE